MRLAAGAGDQLRRVARAQRVALEDPPGAPRLHDHDAHRVRDDVVHLAGDPLALLDHGALGMRGAALVGPRDRLVQLAGQAGAAAGRAAREAERRHEQGREGDVAERERAADRSGGDDPGHEHRDARDRAAAILVCSEAERQGQQREPDRRQVAGRRQPLDGDRHDEEADRRPQRPRARPRQRQHEGRDGDHVDRDRAAEVADERELAHADGERDSGEGPVEALRAPHAALPAGRRARRACPPSRELAVLSSPP